MYTVRTGNLVLGDGIPKICVPVVGRTEKEILEQAEQAVEAVPDLLEWRADLFEGSRDKSRTCGILTDLAEITGDMPLLFTYRSRREGGEGEAPAEAYTALLQAAAEHPGVALIDVEARFPQADIPAVAAQLQRAGKRVIASAHFFSRTPAEEERDAVLDLLIRTGADILKLAVMPQSAEDTAALISWTEKKTRELDRPLITMAMGELGKLSRVSGRLTGSAVTFGTVGGSSAPGQIPVDQLRMILAGLGQIQKD